MQLALALIPSISSYLPIANLTASEEEAYGIRNQMTVAAICAERHAICARSATRYETGDREGLSAPGGHYMAGDAMGVRVLDWMTADERARFHLLGLALPTAGEEQEAARARVQARIAARRALRSASASTAG